MSSSPAWTRWPIAFALAASPAVAVWLALVPPSQPALAAALPAVTNRLDRAQLEQRAEAAFARWQQGLTLPDEQDEWANDGLYEGATVRADGGGLTFEVGVARGIGLGTQSRSGCGTAPMVLRITPMGEVSGMALVFSESCVKTELTIRGRAGAGMLLLRLGSQYVELSKRDDQALLH
jgi:hypothetical protein